MCYSEGLRYQVGHRVNDEEGDDLVESPVQDPAPDWFNSG